jgi:hypothetical protein
MRAGLLFWKWAHPVTRFGKENNLLITERSGQGEGDGVSEVIIEFSIFEADSRRYTRST